MTVNDHWAALPKIKNNYGYYIVYYPQYPRAFKSGGYKGYVLYHILVAEKALGKYLDIKHQVHHFDERKRNNKNNNLVICEDQAYHTLLHTRQRIVNYGGNPNLHKICSTCDKLKLRNEFHSNYSNFDNLHRHCIPCRKLKGY